MGKHKRLLLLGAILLLALIGGGLVYLMQPKPDITKFVTADKCQEASSEEIRALIKSNQSGNVLERAGICAYNEARYDEAKQLYEAAKKAYTEEGQPDQAKRVEQYVKTTDGVLQAKEKPARSIDELPPPRITEPGEIKDE